jgi:hypothetical protein
MSDQPPVPALASDASSCSCIPHSDRNIFGAFCSLEQLLISLRLPATPSFLPPHRVVRFIVSRRSLASLAAIPAETHSNSSAQWDPEVSTVADSPDRAARETRVVGYRTCKTDGRPRTSVRHKSTWPEMETGVMGPSSRSFYGDILSED